MLMIEAVISLAICAALLTAVASGFVAASQAIESNDQFNHATQIGRVILVQFEEQIRTGYPHSDFATDGSGNITTLHVTTASGLDRTYTYSPNLKELLVYTNATGSGTPYVVARDVTNCSLTATTGVDASGASCVTQASLAFTVTVGSNSVTMSGAAVPRKCLLN
ncbi:MAG TPA: hypothetical protein VFE58_14090 [Tepidisphaeraceae bacterium]|nr:hypothetical protein [Tepidisphaeraceae bacterium]